MHFNLHITRNVLRGEAPPPEQVVGPYAHLADAADAADEHHEAQGHAVPPLGWRLACDDLYTCKTEHFRYRIFRLGVG